MKNKVLSFLSGVLCIIFIIGLPVTALAASNGFTIECYPIKVLVNGEVFQPKDAKGNDVMERYHLCAVKDFDGSLWAGG